VWGWRLPFLITVVFAPIALILRMHMPEPYEFLQSKQTMVLERVASTAAARVARQYSAQHSRSPSMMSSRQLSLRLQSATQVVLPAEAPGSQGAVDKHTAAAGPKGHIPAASTARCNSTDYKDVENVPQNDSETAVGSSAAPVLRVLSGRRLGSDACVSSPGADGTGPQAPGAKHEASTAGVPEDCEQDYVAELKAVGAVTKHHVPVVVLFRDHWRGVLLQFLLEAM